MKEYCGNCKWSGKNTENRLYMGGNIKVIHSGQTNIVCKCPTLKNLVVTNGKVCCGSYTPKQQENKVLRNEKEEKAIEQTKMVQRALEVQYLKIAEYQKSYKENYKDMLQNFLTETNLNNGVKHKQTGKTGFLRIVESKLEDRYKKPYIIKFCAYTVYGQVSYKVDIENITHLIHIFKPCFLKVTPVKD